MRKQHSAVRGYLVATATLAILGAIHPALATDLDGAGSTFVAPVMTSWAESYKAKTGIDVAYQAVGSGAGIQKVEAGEVDFGATDMPLKSEDLRQHNLCQFPIVVGGISPVANLPGVSGGQLKFSGKLLADIFLGKVTSWDDPEVKALNPDVPLPHLAITVVHRSDGSGTTYNWVDFLSKTSSAWKDSVGVGLTVPWPTGQAGAGNAGVAAIVKATSGAIGYVEYAFAVKEGLAFALVQNGYGLFVPPDADTFQSAAGTVRWRDHQDFDVLVTDARGTDAYPITATTFVLMPKSPHDTARAEKGLLFFKWALEEGDRQAADLNYAALPPQLVALIKAYWRASALPGATGEQAAQ